MRVVSLVAERVRSISRASVTLADGFTLVTGPNGAGKTNLLEALHLLVALRPLTTTSPAEVVQHGAADCVVEGVLGGGVLPLGVRVVLQGARRRAWVAGKPLREPEAYLGALATVAFTPDDMQLVKAGPSGRRAFLGRASVELWPATRDELRRLERTLRQRAAALKRGAAPAVLEAIDGPFTAAALATWRRRERALAALAPHAVRWLAHLLDGRVLGLRLRAGIPDADGFPALDDPGRAAALAAGLAASLDEDRRRASTSFGPHHDEIELRVDGTDARRFASQGQQRCVALALTLAVVDAVAEARATPPLVLLDDVSSELDPVRRGALFDALARARCQVVATATHAELLPVPAGYLGGIQRYTAAGGTFTAA